MPKMKTPIPKYRIGDIIVVKEDKDIDGGIELDHATQYTVNGATCCDGMEWWYNAVKIKYFAEENETSVFLEEKEILYSLPIS